MLKRIFTIGLITGTGQLFVVFALKYISQNSSPQEVKAIGQIDSLVLFMMNLIALGLQPSAMRDLALTENWKEEYVNTQSARLTLSIFIGIFALLAFIDPYYLAFLIAPLLALSGDYALYGRGLPVKGAIVAFVRVIIPFLITIVFLWKQPLALSWIYFLGLFFTYVITNTLISFFLDMPSLPKFNIASLKLYFKTIPLGLVSLNLYFIGMGVILIAPYFYPAGVIATAFVGLKFYVIFKGVLRIIQQAFLKDMIKDEVCLKVDQLSSLLGFTFFVFMCCFTDTFIGFFFGSRYNLDKNYFILIAAAAFVYSIFSSFTTRAMLERKDNHYAITTTLAALLTLLSCVVLSFVSESSLALGISILLGEISFAAGMLWLMKKKKLFFERIRFLAKNTPLIIIPLAAIFIPGDKIIVFFSALIIFISLLFLLHKNKFSFSESDQA